MGESCWALLRDADFPCRVGRRRRFGGMMHGSHGRYEGVHRKAREVREETAADREERFGEPSGRRCWNSAATTRMNRRDFHKEDRR